jgi:hypothetical protein
VQGGGVIFAVQGGGFLLCGGGGWRLVFSVHGGDFFCAGVGWWGGWEGQFISLGRVDTSHILGKI